MARNKQVGRVVTIAGIAAIGALVTFMVLLQAAESKNNNFKRAFERIVLDTNALTEEYQVEEGRWKAGRYDNATMVSIVEKYLPRYQELVGRAEALETPDKYRTAQGLLVKAIQSEKESNEHFRNYLATGDRSEYEKSSDLLSKSLAYSVDADAAIKAAG